MRIAYLHYLTAEDMALHHVRQFATAARALGHHVDVHAMNLAQEGTARDSNGVPGRLRAALKHRFGRYLHEPKELLWNARYVRAELKLLASLAPDVLLVRDHLLTASCVPVARRLRLPLVLEMNAPADESRLYLDEYVHLPRVPVWLEAWKLRRADAVTVVSSSLRAHIVECYGVCVDKVHVVSNGADVDLFGPQVPVDPAVDGVRAENPVVGFVGSFQKWHGSDTLTRMMCEVGAARESVRFVLVGDGPGLAAVRRATASLGDRVLCTGTVPHQRVPGLVASCDVCVLPEADFYRCPLKLIEWMAAGRAIVAPRYAPLLDLIEDGVHGLLFPPGDEPAFVRAVMRLLDDASLRLALGTAAMARARASLTWTENARRVLAACEQARQSHQPNGTVRS